ncbi:hypothetical protein M9Y10_042184 [Tritrichomonas musculus]|uniref:Uncharacterized protein n=1 Tax=Tritrichomonas musculus TaxID=1915356 RepID=A0ABR2K7F0_9EUKA
MTNEFFVITKTANPNYGTEVSHTKNNIYIYLCDKTDLSNTNDSDSNFEKIYFNKKDEKSKRVICILKEDYKQIKDNSKLLTNLIFIINDQENQKISDDDQENKKISDDDQENKKISDDDQENKKISDDAVLFLYFLHDKRFLCKNYCHKYKFLINKLNEIMKKLKENQFETEFNNQTWINFFHWLHDLEPSLIYSYFLCRYYMAYKQEETNLKMPALYFTPYFLKKLPQLEHEIIKNYIEALDMLKHQNKIESEIFLISIFHFFSPPIENFEWKNTNISIIKGRLNQSSHVTQFIVNCFKSQIKEKIKENFEGINSLFTIFLQNSLTFEHIQSEAELKGKEINQIIDPEQNDQILYFGLPDRIYIKTKQDDYDFCNKNVFINYPLELSGNPKLKFQIKTVIDHFSSNLNDENNIKFIILKENTYKILFYYRQNGLFSYFFKKYSDYRIPIQFESNDCTKEERLIKKYQASLNIHKNQSFYRSPLLLSHFINLLKIEKDKSNTENTNLQLNRSRSTNCFSIDNPFKSNYCLYTTVIPIINSPKKKDNILKSQKGRKNNQSNKSNNNLKSAGSCQALIESCNVINSNKEDLILQNEKSKFFFIRERRSQYFFIDTISNYINDQFARFHQLFEFEVILAYRFKSFNIHYLRKRIQLNLENMDEVANNKDDIANDLYIDNVIKISLCGILIDQFSKFRTENPDFKFLSPSHLLFLFVFYKYEEIKNNESLICKKDESKIELMMEKAYNHIRTMSEEKVEKLTLLYTYDYYKPLFTSNEKGEKEKINFYFNPPPSIRMILFNFKKAINNTIIMVRNAKIGNNDELTAKGKQEAEDFAKNFYMEPDLVICSPNKSALETSKPFNDIFEITVAKEISDYIREFTLIPKEKEGVKEISDNYDDYDEEEKKIPEKKKKTKNNENTRTEDEYWAKCDPGIRYHNSRDNETFSEFILRTKAFIQYVHQQTSNIIVVFTHSRFMTLMELILQNPKSDDKELMELFIKAEESKFENSKDYDFSKYFY